MRPLITGATGFIGRHLLAQLDRPVVLTRDPQRARQALAANDVQIHAWEPLNGPPPSEAFDGIDIVFHLAGESVASGRWTAKRKREIRESREIGTRNLVATLRQLTVKPKALLSASAVGYYGSRGDDVLDELAPPGTDFLAEVCQAWEREAMAATDTGIRVVCLRTGVVLGPDGGALKKMLLPFRLGVGGRLGSGRQWMPWIHIDDLIGLYLHAANRPGIAGPMNGVAPNPVANREFTKAFARTLHRPAILPTPYFALRVAMGEFAKVLFDSQRVAPKVAQETSFQFRYPEIEAALKSILSAEFNPRSSA
jgi:uncharacterized protein